MACMWLAGWMMLTLQVFIVGGFVALFALAERKTLDVRMVRELSGPTRKPGSSA